MSEEEKSPLKQHRSHTRALVLATVLSVIGACAMAGSIAIENFTRRFPNRGNLNANLNIPPQFNATRTFNAQVVVQRIPPNVTYGSWLGILGFACLVGITIILVALLFQNR